MKKDVRKKNKTRVRKLFEKKIMGFERLQIFDLGKFQ